MSTLDVLDTLVEPAAKINGACCRNVLLSKNLLPAPSVPQLEETFTLQQDNTSAPVSYTHLTLPTIYSV